VECTVNRVGDQYFDQLERNGHATRIDDLDLFASWLPQSGYPVLWGGLHRTRLEQANWSWADERLGRLRELGIRPIVVCFTTVVVPATRAWLIRLSRLTEFARAVAQRYRGDSYTP